MNPTNESGKPAGIVRKFASTMGNAIGVRVAPTIPTVSDTPKFATAPDVAKNAPSIVVPTTSVDFNKVEPQVGFQAPVPTAVENAFQAEPQGALDPNSHTGINQESITVVPAEKAPDSTVQTGENVATVPLVEPPPPITPVVRPEPPTFTPTERPDLTSGSEKIVNMPIQPEDPNGPPPPVETSIPRPQDKPLPDIVAEEKVEEKNVPEDPIATSLIEKNPAAFIENGVLNEKALEQAVLQQRVSENPKAQALVASLHAVGVVKPEAVLQAVKPMLDLPKAA